MNVIFLDIDGVLNTNWSISRCGYYLGIDTARIKLLKQIVEATDAKIVLSSDWRYEFEVGAYKQKTHHCKYLSNKLRKQGLTIYDKTENFGHLFRGKEIHDYLIEHPEITGYVVLDDRVFDFEDYPDVFNHFIKTFNWREWGGLYDELVPIAIDIINGNRTEPVASPLHKPTMEMLFQ